jgi:DNA-binding response OmpR family regulator
MGTHATALLVDNDPTTADVLRAALANEPYAFDAAYDLATAIRCLDSGRYLGVIVDLGLPQGSGYDVLRHMSSCGIALPIVVIASRLPESVRAALAREHVTLVLPKPTETWLLLNVMRGLCALNEAGTPAPSQSLQLRPKEAPRSQPSSRPATPAGSASVPEERPRR